MYKHKSSTCGVRRIANKPESGTGEKSRAKYYIPGHATRWNIAGIWQV